MYFTCIQLITSMKCIQLFREKLLEKVHATIPKGSRFDSYSVRNSVLIISHITFRDCRVHIFPDNLSRNSCLYYKLTSGLHTFQMALLAQFDKTFQSSRFEPL